MGTRLDEILTINCRVRGPADLAVKLAKSAKRKRNPIVGAVLITVDSNGSPGAAWTSMSGGELVELERFFKLVLDEHCQAIWSGELDAGEYDEDVE